MYVHAFKLTRISFKLPLVLFRGWLITLLFFQKRQEQIVIKKFNKMKKEIKSNDSISQLVNKGWMCSMDIYLFPFDANHSEKYTFVVRPVANYGNGSFFAVFVMPGVSFIHR